MLGTAVAARAGAGRASPMAATTKAAATRRMRAGARRNPPVTVGLTGMRAGKLMLCGDKRCLRSRATRVRLPLRTPAGPLVRGRLRRADGTRFQGDEGYSVNRHER